MSGIGQEGLPMVRVALAEVWVGWKGIGRPSQRSGSGREAHPKDRNGLGSPPGGPGGVEKPSWWFGRGRESFSKVRKGSGVVGRPTRRSKRCREPYQRSGKCR